MKRLRKAFYLGLVLELFTYTAAAGEPTKFLLDPTQVFIDKSAHGLYSKETGHEIVSFYHADGLRPAPYRYQIVSAALASAKSSGKLLEITYDTNQNVNVTVVPKPEKAVNASALLKANSDLQAQLSLCESTKAKLVKYLSADELQQVLIHQGK